MCLYVCEHILTYTHAHTPPPSTHTQCEEVRGQLAGDSSFFLLCESRGLNSGHQRWQQAPFPTKLPCLTTLPWSTYTVFIFNCHWLLNFVHFPPSAPCIAGIPAMRLNFSGLAAGASSPAGSKSWVVQLGRSTLRFCRGDSKEGCHPRWCHEWL